MYDDESSDDEDEEEEGGIGDMDLSTADELGCPTQYRRSGEKGEAPATVLGRNAALVHFNDFLSTKNLPSFDVLTEDQLCSKPLWQEYGTYLSEFAKKKKNKVSHIAL